ncbi:hypothetical protein VN12_22955 [Pirellula sp. SH-Sr6A]|nr:hypothetical protein VN12_22955 [Pirellula sp. SH-Sr6A]
MGMVSDQYLPYESFLICQRLGIFRLGSFLLLLPLFVAVFAPLRETSSVLLGEGARHGAKLAEGRQGVGMRDGESAI